ncbi:sigma-54-dependent Fis family transcriptional regulator [uncultured Thiodictyon sp.]|jgi:transcriptional regulator of acetoin/glycerol metabolism|uniref:sigma-54-dependent Fis family transcriptional regulator n=1 Tax=uncultured Thiodictyon sp. TaxID=1846217 RepID=UPI0025F1420A|nr:sigma-54-dependent Fis family transcriptional regulator [uncultured Thiodictyon sp.]
MYPSSDAAQHAHQVASVGSRGAPDAAAANPVDPAEPRPPGAPDLPAAILQSWQRCLAQPGLDPFSPREPEVLDAGRLRDRTEPLAGLLRLAESELGLLLESFGGSGYAVILTDAAGVILRHRCDPTLERELRAAGLWTGADWGETRLGTNGIGTCIVEGRPVTVHREDHFLRQNIGLTCSAAPIRDPQGRLLGVLDVSCCAMDHSRAGQALARALVSKSASILENQHFLRQYRAQRVLRCHPRPEGIGLPQESLIALGEDNRVLAVNQAALTLLGGGERARLQGRALAEVLAGNLDALRCGVPGREGSIREFQDQERGGRLFGFVYQYRKPARRTDLRVPPAPAAVPASVPGGGADLGHLETLAGSDPGMQQAAARARRVMNKRIPILLHGETGTGKELFSQAVHRASDRRERPFVALNCAAIPETLIESELFGYKAGAFTGASREGRRGRIAESSGGTLFLDEIADMPLPMQSRLLRVLETQEVVPLGAGQVVRVELNIIAASHQDLAQRVVDGRFREDLFYRLNGITLHLTPLRLRGDLEEIVLKVLEAQNDTGQALGVTPAAMAALLAFEWPGNIRQLRNVIRTAVALCEEGVIEVEHLNLPRLPRTAAAPSVPEPQTVSAPAAAGPLSADPLKAAELEVIRAGLERHHWNISRTAASLNMSRNTLYRKIERHGLAPR